MTAFLLFYDHSLFLNCSSSESKIVGCADYIGYVENREYLIFRLPEPLPQCNARLDEVGGQWRYLWIIILDRMFGKEIKGKTTPEKELVPQFSAGESMEERV
jgi:hypothetical protein